MNSNRFAMGLAVSISCLIFGAQFVAGQTNEIHEAIATVQPKMVKLNGSGGFQGLESYQSGFLVASDGFIVTAWSYVLDSDTITVTLNDGKKYEGSLVGYDPRVEIAVLKIEATDLDFFNLDTSSNPKPGTRILAFSNLFGVATGDEQASVLHGVISATTHLSARKGSYESPYKDEVLILDSMTNNPGAAGGAVTDMKGQLVGFIGKEMRDSKNNMWLNFAIPIDKIAGSVESIRSGKALSMTQSNRRHTEPMTLELLGIRLVPDVVAKTPPYVDQIETDSAAQQNGILPDDLIVEINGQMTASRRDLDRILTSYSRDSTIKLTVQRVQQFETFELKINR